MAMNAYRNYTNNVSAMQKNLEKLSSGYKINRAGDDAAGLAISEKMRAQITGLQTAQKNAKDGISLVQTAEGALTEVHDMLNRMVELATQSANGTYDNDVDRAQMQKEVNQLREEINRIADSSNFNGIKLLDGSLGLNKTAFNITGTTEMLEGTEVTNGFTLPDKVDSPTLADRGTGTILHKSGQAATAGEFKVDLTELNVKVNSAGTLNFKIGDKTVAAATFTAGDKGALTPATLATKIAGKLTAGLWVNSSGAVVTSTCAGGLHYSVTDNGDGTLTFKTDKYGTAKTTAATLSNGVLVSAVHSGAAITPGFTVAVSAATSADFDIGGEAGDHGAVNTQNIHTTPITTPTRPSATQLASTIVTLNTANIKDGSKITFDGETYTIALGSNSKYADGENVIDLTEFDATNVGAITGTGKLDKAMGIIADTLNGSSNFSVGYKKGDNNKLTVFEMGDGTEATPTSAASEGVQEKLKTETGFKSLFKLTNPDTAAAINMTVTDSAVKDGNALVIGDKKYVFTTKPGEDSEDVTYIKIGEDGSGAAAGLKTALENDGYTVEGTNDLKIFAKGDAVPTILGKGLTLQIGDTADSYNQLNVSIRDMHCNSLGIDKISVEDQDSAAEAVKKIKDAINSVSDLRGTLGATQNRLDHTINNLSVMTENIQDAESTIRDVDVAEEMMAYTKNNILIQSAQAMLAQANQVPQGVLQLLG